MRWNDPIRFPPAVERAAERAARSLGRILGIIFFPVFWVVAPILKRPRMALKAGVWTLAILVAAYVALWGWLAIYVRSFRIKVDERWTESGQDWRPTETTTKTYTTNRTALRMEQHALNAGIRLGSSNRPGPKPTAARESEFDAAYDTACDWLQAELDRGSPEMDPPPPEFRAYLQRDAGLLLEIAADLRGPVPPQWQNTTPRGSGDQSYYRMPFSMFSRLHKLFLAWALERSWAHDQAGAKGRLSDADLFLHYFCDRNAFAGGTILLSTHAWHIQLARKTGMPLPDEVSPTSIERWNEWISRSTWLDLAAELRCAAEKPGDRDRNPETGNLLYDLLYRSPMGRELYAYSRLRASEGWLRTWEQNRIPPACSPRKDYGWELLPQERPLLDRALYDEAAYAVPNLFNLRARSTRLLLELELDEKLVLLREWRGALGTGPAAAPQELLVSACAEQGAWSAWVDKDGGLQIIHTPDQVYCPKRWAAPLRWEEP